MPVTGAGCEEIEVTMEVGVSRDLGDIFMNDSRT
jgi:hypothetical protein